MQVSYLGSSCASNLRDVHGTTNAIGDLGSRMHDYTESSLESIPETEVLEGCFIEAHQTHVSNLVADLANLTQAILGIEIVDGVRSGSPVLLVVVG